MDIERAFEILELPLDADVQQVRSAYRALSRKSHPDISSGKKEAQVLLNTARDTALAYTKIKSAVVPISPGELSRTIRNALASHNAESARETAQNIFRRRTSGLNQIKWSFWIVGATGGIVSLVGSNKDGLSILIPSLTTDFKTLLQLISFGLGGFGLLLQFIIKTEEMGIDQFLGRISHEADCARELAMRLDHVDVLSVRESSLRGRSSSSVAILRHPFFPRIDDSPILLRKSIEHGLLTPNEVDEITPDFNQTYTVKFRPSLFRPQPPAPPKPRTESEVRSSLTTGLVMASVTGLVSIVFVFFGLGWWAIIPVFLTLAILALDYGEYKELRRFRHKKED